MNTGPATDSTKPSPSANNRLFRRIRKWVICIFITIFLIITSGLLIGWIYAEEVKKYVITELNKQLDTQVIIDTKDIHFSIIKNFPYASVDFKNLKAMDATTSKRKDTLFAADKISFQFNLPNLLRKNYSIKKIKIENVKLDIRVDEEGKDNYHFWRKASADNASDNFAFALEKIELKDIHVVYSNLKTSQILDARIKKGDFSGKFSATTYFLSTKGEIFIDLINKDSVLYLKRKNIYMDLVMNINNQTSTYTISSSKVKIENLLFELSGDIRNNGSSPFVNIAAQGKDMDIKSILSLIPQQYKKKIEDYSSTGEFYFKATIQGIVNDEQLPLVSADFGMRNATIEQIREKVTLSNVNLKGYYSNGSSAMGKPSSLLLSPFSARIKNDNVSGELSILNFENPSVKGKIKADFNLSELQHFVKLDTIDRITGQVSIDAVFKAEQRNSITGAYKDVSTAGDLKIKGMHLHIKNNILRFSGINGDFKFNNNDLIVNNFSGNISNSDFELKGFFRNIVGYVLKDKQNIEVEATLNSKKINLDELLANKQEDKTPQTGDYKLKFSEHINVNLNSEIEELKFRNFEASNIRGIIKLKDKKLVVDPVTFSTMSGTMTTSGVVDGSDTSKIVVTCFSDVNKINISQLFLEFENFGQSTITNKNIKGLATFKINFSSELTPELDMNLNKIFSSINLNIENGELNNVEAMKSLSRFIDLKELESIRFATLKNQIEIKNQMIYIPKMEIKSSALDLTVSGTHNFDNRINYRIKLAMNDLLARKAKKNKKENDEFGEIADDGLGRTNLFLLMSGSVEKPVIKYDSKSAVQYVKQGLKEEKKTFKSVLKDEFGMFKKDTTLPKNRTKPAPARIKWEGADKKEEKKVLKKPKKEEEDF